MMHIKDFLKDFCANHEFGIAKSTLDCWYLPAISDFSKHLGHDATLDDLKRENLNQWIASKQEKGSSSSTIRTRRNAILALWRSAYEAEKLNVGPDRIRRIRRILKPIEAWEREEMLRLVEWISNSMRDRQLKMINLPYRQYLKSLVLTAYDTGLRLGDLLSLEIEWISRDQSGHGYLLIVQAKTKRLVRSRIDRSTMIEIDKLVALQPNRRLIWPLWCRRDSFYAAFKRVVKQSEIRSGTFRWIRRASTTHVEVERPGTGSVHAGHADSRVTAQHYLDFRQLSKNVSGPKPLIGPEMSA